LEVAEERDEGVVANPIGEAGNFGFGVVGKEKLACDTDVILWVI